MSVFNKLRLNPLEPYLVIVIIFATLFVNLSTFIYRSVTTPPGRVFTGAQFYTDDYMIYVANIRQGQDGYWLNRIKDHTDAFGQPSLVHEEYLLWGKFMGVFGISPILAYHLGRAFFGTILLITIYCLLWKLFPLAKEAGLRLGSYLLICFGAGFLKINGSSIMPYGSWLTELDPTQRFGALIHYSLGFTLLVLLIVLFWYKINHDGLSDRKKTFWFAVVCCSLPLGFVLPATFLLSLMIFSMITLGFGLKWLINKSNISWENFRFSIHFVITLLVTNLPVLIYYRWLFANTHWGAILAWEKLTQVTFDKIDFLMGLGPTAFLSLLGLLAIRERRKMIFILYCWLGAVIAGSLFIAPLINFNPTRFLQNPIYIPLAILTILGVEKISRLIKSRLRVIAFWSAVLLLMAISIPTNLVSLKNQYLMFADHSELIYPTFASVEAYNFLAKSTRPDEGVLTLYMAGNHLPFMSGNNILIGHLEGMTLHSSAVQSANQFYADQLMPDKAQQFLRDNYLKYVFWGPQEKSLGGDINKYSFLQPIFTNQAITIFKVK